MYVLCRVQRDPCDCHPFVHWYRLSFYSFILTPSCVRVHMTEVLQASNRCRATALEEGQRFGPVSHAWCLYPPVLGVPVLFFLSFSFQWSIHHKLQAVVIRWHRTCAHISLGGGMSAKATLYSNRTSASPPYTSGHFCKEAAFIHLLLLLDRSTRLV